MTRRRRTTNKRRSSKKARDSLVQRPRSSSSLFVVVVVGDRAHLCGRWLSLLMVRRVCVCAFASLVHTRERAGARLRRAPPLEGARKSGRSNGTPSGSSGDDGGGSGGSGGGGDEGDEQARRVRAHTAVSHQATNERRASSHLDASSARARSLARALACARRRSREWTSACKRETAIYLLRRRRHAKYLNIPPPFRGSCKLTKKKRMQSTSLVCRTLHNHLLQWRRADRRLHVQMRPRLYGRPMRKARICRSIQRRLVRHAQQRRQRQ